MGCKTTTATTPPIKDGVSRDGDISVGVMFSGMRGRHVLLLNGWSGLTHSLVAIDWRCTV